MSPHSAMIGVMLFDSSTEKVKHRNPSRGVMLMKLKRLMFFVFALTMLSWRAEADGIRLFETEAGTGYAVFHQKMVDADCVEGGRYAAQCLADEAYAQAKKSGAITTLPLSNQTQASYTNLFIVWNDLGSTISPTFFQKKGLGTGFWLPQAPKLATVEAEVVKTTAPEPATALATMLNELSGLKAQIGVLTKQVESLKLGDPALAEGIEGTIAQVEEKVATLAASTATADAKFLEEFASLLGAVNLIKQQMRTYQEMTTEQVADLKQEVAQGIAGAKAPIDSRISDLESAIADLKTAVAGKADTTVVAALADTVAKNKEEAAEASAALKTEVAEVAGRLETVEEAIDGLPASLDARIEAKLREVPQGYLSSGLLLAVLAVILVILGYVLLRLRAKASKSEVTTAVASAAETSKTDLDKLATHVTTLHNQTDERLKGIEKNVGVLYEVHLEESGHISDLPTNKDLQAKKKGDVFQVWFNDGADVLSFAVVPDRQHSDVLMLHVSDWPKDWPQKRSSVALRTAAIVALVKEYNVKKGVPKPTASTAKPGKEKVTVVAPVAAPQTKAVS